MDSWFVDIGAEIILTRRFHLIRMVLIFAALANPIPSVAKPMNSPTLEEGAKSKWIVVGTYIDYKNPGNEKVTDLGNVVAHYKVDKILKGAAIADKEIDVVYDFSDGSACIPSRDWQFSSKMMPKPGSKWILLLDKGSQSEVWKQYKHLDVYTTYRGDFGRLEDSNVNVSKITALIGAK